MNGAPKGRPVSSIKPALKREWERDREGAHISDPELTTYATAISEGRSIKFTFDGLKH